MNSELEVQFGVGVVALPVVDRAGMLQRKAGTAREFLSPRTALLNAETWTQHVKVVSNTYATFLDLTILV